jgi:RimJ/RimL family protein N-acetyltransferase
MTPETTPSMSAAVAAYQARIRTRFATLKSATRYDDLLASSIRLKDNNGYLLCVSELHCEDDEVIRLFAKWREEALTFHNKFKVTFESTKRWTRKLLLDVPDRILFLVTDPFGHPIGHMGFANALNNEGWMEFDNVVRGVQNARPGIMSLATQAILEWAQLTFEPNGFYLRTLDNNLHAIQFYERMGFRRVSQQGLRRIQTEDGFNHVPIPEGDTNPPDRYFVRMNYEPKFINKA